MEGSLSSLGCCYYGGGFFCYIALLPPPLPPTQPITTIITTPATSLPTHNQQTDEDEENTSTTSIDVSSLTENQPSVIQTPDQRPKSRSKSLNQLLLVYKQNAFDWFVWNDDYDIDVE